MGKHSFIPHNKIMTVEDEKFIIEKYFEGYHQ